MIFSPELAAKVLSGEKTVTRRRLAHRDGRPIRYKEGGVYAVQPGRGKQHLGHIRVLGIRLEALGMITAEGAEEEGFPGTFGLSAFVEKWLTLHRIWNPVEEVACIRFQRAPSCDRCAG